jgi:hypothetical protein
MSACASSMASFSQSTAVLSGHMAKAQRKAEEDYQSLGMTVRVLLKGTAIELDGLFQFFWNVLLFGSVLKGYRKVIKTRCSEMVSVHAKRQCNSSVRYPSLPEYRFA